MPKFIKLTNFEDENDVERMCCIDCSLIQYMERNRSNFLTAIVHSIKDMGILYVKETPEEILKLIAECEDN